jgi:hypothetical protein
VLELSSTQLADGLPGRSQNQNFGAGLYGFAKRNRTRTRSSGDVIRPNRVKPTRGVTIETGTFNPLIVFVGALNTHRGECTA